MNDQLNRIEWKLDQLLAAFANNARVSMAEPSGAYKPDASRELLHQPQRDALPPMTVKQHAVLQMLLRGATNLEIAERFRVTENTSKVYVRTIARKLGVNTRAQIVMRTLTPFNAIDGNSYMLLAHGLPKTWDQDYSEPDPFYDLYTRAKEDE